MSEQQRVATEPELVRVFLRGGIIAEGQAHVHAGAYEARVSDLLNRQAEDFLPLTDVTYEVPGSPARRTGAFLVHREDIVAVDLVSGPRDDEGDGVDRDEPDEPPRSSPRAFVE